MPRPDHFSMATNGIQIIYFVRTVDEVIESDLLDLIGEILDL